ncbi:MAG: transglycosylase domain-containing protein [Treponemataceae bacterium]|nr:transglycosylase domain-containing protein [Treponemataceae bacterium]
MKLKVPKKKPAKALLLLLAFAVLLGISLFLLLSFSPYPEIQAFLQKSYSTAVFDRDGILLQVLPLDDGLRRQYTPLEEIPEVLVSSFIQAEDKRFYEHHGVDFIAIIRALFQNISDKRIVSGASTITMQLARLISPREDRNLAIKIKEAFDALRLECRLSKKEILDLYLNNVPFGFNTEGVTSAAKTFFSKELNELSEAEIRCLSVIIRRPSSYNPLKEPEKCTNAVMDVFGNDIEEDTILKAARQACSYDYPFLMPHYINFLKAEYPQEFSGKKAIRLSASAYLQGYIEELLTTSVKKFESNRITNGAVLVLDTRTAEILAWAGSSSFQDETNKGQLDGVTVPNQPGSSMKPFLYALALDKGYLPSDILPDIPTDFGFEELYIPQNFNNRFNGPVRMRTALASSLNVPAVYLLNRIGIKSYLSKLFQLDFQSLKQADPGLGLALGNAEVSIYELASAFSVFPRDGIFISPSYNKEQAAIKEKAAYSVYSKDTARIICSILSDANSRSTGFGFSTVFQTPFSSIFKTGTANQYQNITALAATPLYTVGVWMGNFTGETVIGKTGSSIPASMAKEILCFLQGAREVPFKEPEQFKKERICSLSGKKAGDLCPTSLYEYIPVASIAEESYCDWHTGTGIKYPAEYEKWLLMKTRTGTADGKTSTFSIVSPKDGSVFFHDQSSALNKRQNLSLEFSGGAEDSMQLKISDGENLMETTLNRPFIISIPIRRASYTIEAVCGAETVESRFSVR